MYGCCWLADDGRRPASTLCCLVVYSSRWPHSGLGALSVSSMRACLTGYVNIVSILCGLCHSHVLLTV